MRFVMMRSKTEAPHYASEAARLRALAAQVTTPQMRERLMELAAEVTRGKGAEPID
jgi:hypothetical protein